ncbi:hypothetical protein YC2023_008605 [Brassica napus]
MNPLNLATTSSPSPVANDLLAKRKRGRPRKNETTTQPQQENVNLVGKTFSAVVAGSFDTGHIVNVKVNDSDTELIGFVFMKGKVTPVAPENDVAPHVKMVAKEGIKNQTDLPPNDQPVKDVEICESARPLSLVPYQSDDEEPKEAVVEERDGNYDWLDPLSGYVGNPSSGPAIINKHLFSYSLRVISIRFKLSTRTSPNPTDDHHSIDESSLDQRVLTRPFCHHSAQSVLSQSLDLICAIAWLNLSRSLARSLYSARIDLSQSLRSLSPRGVDVSIQKQGLAEAYPYLTYPSWLDDESSRKQLARALAIVIAQSLGSISRGHSLALLTRPTSPHSTDESSLDRRVVTRPTSPHSTDESSLDRGVVTRPTSPHSTDESSLGRFVVTRPFCRHSAQSVLSRSLDSICAVAWLDLSRSLARSLYSAQIDLSQSLRYLSPRGVDVSIQQQGLAEEYPYLTYPSLLHDESSRKQLTRALAVTRLDLSRSLGADRSRAVTWLDLSRSLARSPYSAQNDLSQLLRSLSPRGVDVSFCRHPIDESSLDRRVLTRPTSRHSTVLSSLDRRVITRPFSRHSTDESSLDRRVITRSTSRHSTDESSLDRFVVTRPFCRHSIDESSLDRRVLTRPTSRHSTDDSSLDRFVVTRPAFSHLDLRSRLARSLAVTRLAPLRSLDSLPCGHSTCSSRSLDSLSRSHSARIALSQSLRLLASLEHDVIPRRHVHP